MDVELRQVAVVDPTAQFVCEPALAPDGRSAIFALATRDGSVAMHWTIDRAAPVALELGDEDVNFEPRDGVWSPDGQLVALSGRRDGTDDVVMVLDAGTLRVVDVLSYGEGSACMEAVAFHPSRRLLVTSHENVTVNFWSLEERPARQRRRRPDNADAFAFTPDGRYLIEMGFLGGLRRLAVDSWEEHPLCDGEFYRAVFTGGSGGEVLAVRSGGEVECWDAGDAVLRSTIACEDEIKPTGFEPRRRLLAWTGDGACTLLSLQTGRVVARAAVRTPDHTGQVFSADGRYLMTYGYDARLFEVVVT